MGYSLSDLKSGYGREIGWVVLIYCIGWKRDIIWGKYLRSHVHLVSDMDIIGACRGTINT